MKKTALLHSDISHTIAGLGHGDMIVIGDCGLPVPKHVKKIDLALTRGIPGFIETLQTVLTELHVEQAWIADELRQGGASLYSELAATLDGISMESRPHEAFKKMTDQAVAVIRTGECTPFANVILVSGVVF